MKRLTANIWDAPTGTAIVIPTNVGWRRNGTNVMGRGVARQAAAKYPNLPIVYGSWCQRHGERLLWWSAIPLICFPVKPLFDPPNLSWQQPADLALILRSTIALAALPLRAVWLPLVGCGNGRLEPTLVIPLLERHLDDRFTLVTLKGA